MDLRAEEELMSSSDEELDSDQEDELIAEAVLETPGWNPQMGDLRPLRDLCTHKVMCMTAQRDLDLSHGGIHPYVTAKRLEQLWKENDWDIKWIYSVYHGTNLEYFRFLFQQVQAEFAHKTQQLRLWARGIQDIFYTQRIDIQETFTDVVFRCNLEYQ